MIEWSKELPEEPGWYWFLSVQPPYGDPRIVMVYADEFKEGRLMVHDYPYPLSIRDYALKFHADLLLAYPVWAGRKASPKPLLPVG